jgi:DNA polymerase (family X)
MHAWRDLTGRGSGPPVAARAYDRTVSTALPRNGDLADMLELLADLSEILGEQSFRVAAYRRAAARIRDTASSVAELALEGKAKELPDIGKTIEAKIVEVVETGDMEALAKRRAEVPGEVAAFMRLPGLGPKTAARIWRDLGVTTLAGLKAAAEGEQLRTLAGMGPTTEAKVLKALAEGHGPEQPRRGLLGKGLPVVREVVETLAAHPAALDVSEAGSTRRRRETFRDLDVIATASDPAALTAYFVGLPWVLEVVAHGDTKATVITKQGMRLDLRVVPPESYGDLLQHFTGSKDHNVALREQAQRAGFSVSEYGVTEVESGKVHTFRDEAALYAFLGYSFIPPELREDGGELEAARAGLLPELVELADLRGEMHCHSTWSSDGKATIEEMALAAAARGYEFLCLTDHSHYLREGRIEQQWLQIDEVNARIAPFRVLRGVEANITARGVVDVPDEILAELDWVVASLHTSLDRSPTERVLAAIDNPHVDCIGHLTGRRLSKRPGAELELDPIVARAAETGTALEINSQPDRLDMRDAHARLAGSAGVLIPINTDAHSTASLSYAELGVGQARRAWLTKEQVLNTRPWAEIAKMRR